MLPSQKAKITSPFPPINYCNMASVCVYDSRTVCASTADGCSRRQFIDQCDMYEYNCDYDTHKIECWPHCNRPNAWITTIKGETRDFFRVLQNNK
ncbi:uncharacterized protein LOC131852123 [Achroia grisella]|uniref:uncharacterized protein LOC131852123 n=1 Tax=Achroia grisella TaxID=688607 RepID=UPI0027D2D5B4|nr:uncharacterized protein LOC131852123 [Achroia grisella]